MDAVFSQWEKHTLKGLQPGSLSIISSHRLEKILKKNSHGVIAQLHSLQMQPSVAPTTPLDLQQILDRSTGVFAEPMGLPPSRPEDHRFTSKALSGKNLAASTYEKEMMAILHTV